jgi:hypothetical protein
VLDRLAPAERDTRHARDQHRVDLPGMWRGDYAGLARELVLMQWRSDWALMAVFLVIMLAFLVSQLAF